MSKFEVPRWLYAERESDLEQIQWLESGQLLLQPITDAGQNIQLP